MVEADRQKVIAALKGVGGGSLLRGWRVELDPDGSLDVSFLEFCKACKKLRVAVDATALFGEDSPSELTLDELAPEEGELVFRFRSWLTDRFGSPGEMFAMLEAPEGDGRMCKAEFVAGISKHGFECSQEMMAELFNLLDLVCCGSVRMEDIMFLEMDPRTRRGAIQKAKMRGRIEQEHLLTEMYFEMKKEGLRDGHRLAPRGWHAPWMEKLPEVVIERRLMWKKKELKIKREMLATFNEHVEKKYGSRARAWRRGLDPGGTFKLNRNDFVKYCRRVNMDINAAALWAALDSDCDGVLRIEEVAPKYAASLARFLHWARPKFGSCSAGWPALMAAAKPPLSWKSSSSLQAHDFRRAIKELEWPGAGEPGAGANLAGGLDLSGCGIVSRTDLEWLDKWSPPEWLSAQPDPEAWKQLAQLLLKKHGKPLKAWRQLDEDGSNMASWVEFEHLCNEVGFTGNKGGAWRVLDSDISGFITMQEWHRPSAELLRSFKEWMDNNFGSVKYAFKTIDTDGSGSLSYSELRRMCRRMKWEGDVRLIFQCLNKPIQPGERTLSYKELAFLDNWEPNLGEELEAERSNLASPTSPKLRNSTESSKQMSRCMSSPAGLHGSAPSLPSGPGGRRRPPAAPGAVAPPSRIAAAPPPRGSTSRQATRPFTSPNDALAVCQSSSSSAPSLRPAPPQQQQQHLPRVASAVAPSPPPKAGAAAAFDGSGPSNLWRAHSQQQKPRPRRRYGVGCFREEALASLRSSIQSLRAEASQLEEEHRSMQRATELLRKQPASLPLEEDFFENESAMEGEWDEDPCEMTELPNGSRLGGFADASFTDRRADGGGDGGGDGEAGAEAAHDHDSGGGFAVPSQPPEAAAAAA